MYCKVVIDFKKLSSYQIKNEVPEHFIVKILILRWALCSEGIAFLWNPEILTESSYIPQYLLD